jgi:hypothetical protein
VPTGKAAPSVDRRVVSPRCRESGLCDSPLWTHCGQYFVRLEFSRVGYPSAIWPLGLYIGVTDGAKLGLTGFMLAATDCGGSEKA